MNMRNVLIVIGVLIASALGRMAYIVIPAAGMLDDIQSQVPQQCDALTIAPGTEDVTIDAQSGLAYVSTDDRRNSETSRGAIYAFDIHQTESLRLISPDVLADFHPHGISLWTGPDGAQRLFVVNHRTLISETISAHAIEVFDIGVDGMLTHVESIEYDALRSPNDVIAVGPRSFYATNDRAYHSGMMSTLEAYFGLPLVDVSYFDGETGRIVADGITYANGINISADGNQVYVSELLARRVRVYERDAASGDLRFVRALPVPTAPDNIEVDSDGDLWIGGHPRIMDFPAHASDPNHIAASHAVRLDPRTGEAETVLMALDGEINASSVATMHDGVLIVGAVFDDHVLVCPRL
jgi:arylesterase/paraoxonase